MKVILLGYMASGKSTIGKRLASRNYVPFIDLDSYIEEQENKTISEIFKDEGEIYFRLQEHKYLKELLKNEEDFVLSLGGGTPCYAGNMDLIKTSKDAKSIYLKANIITLTDRLVNQKEKRPLVANLSEEEMKEFIAKHLFERSYFYEQADYTVRIDDKDIKETVTEISIRLH